MKKTIILTLSLACLGILPAMAQLEDIISNTDNQLGKVRDDFTYYAYDLQSYLSNSIPDKFKPADYESQDAIESSLGQLNISDPIAAGQRVNQDITQKSISSTFENNPAVFATATSNEINRQITLGSVQGVLGANGQSQLYTKLNDVQTSVEGIAQYVEDYKESQRNFLEQLVEKACQLTGNLTDAANNNACANAKASSLNLERLIIEGEQTKMMGETLARTAQVHQSLQYSNLNLANISQQMEESNRARRVDASAEAARLLRTTSQADLLGVRTQESGVGSQNSGVRGQPAQ